MQININRHGSGFHQGPGGSHPVVLWLLVKWLCLTAAIMLTAYLVEGIHVQGFAHALGTAAVLGILNIFLRPVLFILTLPINIMTLGLFTFILNALMLKIASGLIPGFSVAGFWAAVLGALLISAANWILNAVLRDSSGGGPGGKRENIIDLKKGDDDRWG